MGMEKKVLLLFQSLRGSRLHFLRNNTTKTTITESMVLQTTAVFDDSHGMSALATVRMIMAKQSIESASNYVFWDTWQYLTSSCYRYLSHPYIRIIVGWFGGHVKPTVEWLG
jgi:hypothetical protein